MDFKPLQLSDLPRIRPLFHELGSRTCDFSAGGMFMWRDFFHMEFAFEDGAFFSRLRGDGQEHYYSLPLSSDIGASIRKLVAGNAGSSTKFCTIPEMYVPLFSEAGHVRSVIEQPDFFDYIYAADELITLKGKKYSGTRNQISQFIRNVDAWEFREIRKEDIGPVCDFFNRTYLPGSGTGAYEREENAKVLEVLENMDAYGMTGGVLFADHAIAGFSLNEVIGDTLYTHIEKAARQFKGVYQMLMNQNAAAFAGDGILYINREEDMGDPGLRKSKLSYHPIEQLKKYIIEVE